MPLADRYGRLFAAAVILLCTNVVLQANAAESPRNWSALYQPCPGRYCGRVVAEDGLSLARDRCGPCPRGTRTDGVVCRSCPLGGRMYDWLYLLLWAGAVFAAHLRTASRHSLVLRERVIVIGVTFATVAASFVGALLCCDPTGSLTLRVCEPERLADWYAMAYNPMVDGHLVRCTQEAVSPLYSLPLIFLVFYLLSGLLWYALPCCGVALPKGALLSQQMLFLVPLLAAAGAILAGFLYYIFPYIMLLGSLWLQARALDALVIARSLPRLLFCHLLLAFCIASLGAFFDASVVVIVVTSVIGPFLPVLVWRVTEPCTRPAAILVGNASLRARSDDQAQVSGDRIQSYDDMWTVEDYVGYLHSS